MSECLCTAAGYFELCPVHGKTRTKRKHTPKPQLEVEVAPGIYQSIEDYEANVRFDEERDNHLDDVSFVY